MPSFQYNIITVDGVSSVGQLKAKSKDAAVKILGLEGAQVVSIARVDTKKKASKILLGRKVLVKKHLTSFTRQLSALLKSGIPLVRSLRTLETQMDKNNPLGACVIKSIADEVEAGGSFSDALKLHKSSFSQFYISMIEVGEVSGSMDVILAKLSIFLENNSRMRRKIISAMAYPVVIMIVALSITYALLTFVLPNIIQMVKDIKSDANASLPWLTEKVIVLSDFLRENVLLTLGGIIFFVFLMKFFKKISIFKFLVDKTLLIIPVLGSTYKKIILTRFAGNLGLLLQTGVPILTSLDITDRSCNNEVVSRIMVNVKATVQDGESLGEGLKSYTFFPPIMISMVEVGEESGVLPDMLASVAKIYEEEVEALIQDLTSVIEPLLMVFMAIVIGTIVIAMMLPMFDLLKGIGG